MKQRKEETTRLNKFIASSGFCSRRKADEYIENGDVKVNGKVMTELGYQVSRKDKIQIGKEFLKPEPLVYVRYYKLPGYITTASDEKGRKTIYDALPEEIRHLNPIGRLDKDSTGLLLLTNDGELANELTHPNLKIPKIYRVCAQGKLTLNDLTTMEKGIEIEDGKIAYAFASIIDFENKNTVLEITLYQGLNRQIRKMLDFLGHPVISLKRLSVANIDLAGLKKGQFKYLKPKQVNELKCYINKLKRQQEKNQ